MDRPEDLGINFKYMPKVYERLKVDTALYNAAVDRFNKIKDSVFDSKYVVVWRVALTFFRVGCCRPASRLDLWTTSCAHFLGLTRRPTCLRPSQSTSQIRVTTL
jgi:hypothetical protein